MKRPFNIFPSKAYKNDHFQVISKVDNLQIDILHGDQLVKSFIAKSNYPVLLTGLGLTGIFLAKCRLNGQVFEQKIEVEEALRLGSSEFKKAFLFDDADYSFLLMKDRLLIYDEKKEVLLTENHYSPTDIRKISDSKFLFITNLGIGSNGIVNLGIYDIETFSIVGDLMNSFSEIAILEESNKAWLLHKGEKTIYCFELVHGTGRCFSILAKFENFNEYDLKTRSNRIVISDHEKVIICDINNLHKRVEIGKKDDISIDQNGNIYYLEDTKLIYQECFTGLRATIQIDLELNLQPDGFIYVGQKFRSRIELTDFAIKSETLKSQIIPTIQENLSYYYHPLPESDWISESYPTHRFYSTIGGIFVFQNTVIRDFKGITLRNKRNTWVANPEPNERNEYSLIFFHEGGSEVLFENTHSVLINKYEHSVLQAIVNNQKKIFVGMEEMCFSNESSLQIIKADEHTYLIVKVEDKFSVFEIGRKIKPLLKNIEILNEGLIDKHKIIWYHFRASFSTNLKQIHAFDLKTGLRLHLDNQKVQESLSDGFVTIQFFKDYALSSNQVIFNPSVPDIKNVVIGKVKDFSKGLNKILSYRDDLTYLATFDGNSRKYNLSEIPIQKKTYKESYLAPNGRFLILMDETNQYKWFDIDNNETVNFFSGKFLAYRGDGNLLVKETNNHRAVKIIDPKTFQEVTPLNYPYFDFISPNGKLFGTLELKYKFYNKLTGKEVQTQDLSFYRNKYEQPKNLDINNLKNSELEIKNNKKQLFETFKMKFKDLGVFEPSEVNFDAIIEKITYVQIGLTESGTIKELVLPIDTQFYNYAAFSYDDRFFGIVGKPFFESINNSFIGIYELDVNYESNTIKVSNEMVSRLPSKACWVCGFSQTGYFATYDSNPDTYLISITDSLFSREISDNEVRKNLTSKSLNYFSSFKYWGKIANKNFLCFSPSGNYLALSEQGYEPLALGGYGHQESSVVHIAETATGKIVQSFTDHGCKLVEHERKDTIFVAFSEDEKRLMTMSKDGVVIVRDINIPEVKSNEQLPQAQNLNIME